MIINCARFSPCSSLKAQYRSLLTARRTGRWKGKTSQQQQQTPIANSSSSGGGGGGSSRLDLGIGARGQDGFREWSNNQAGWYAKLAQQLEQRRGTVGSRGGNGNGNFSVVHLSYERHLVGEGGPDLSPLWQHLNVAPISRAELLQFSREKL